MLSDRARRILLSVVAEYIATVGGGNPEYLAVVSAEGIDIA